MHYGSQIPFLIFMEAILQKLSFCLFSVSIMYNKYVKAVEHKNAYLVLSLVAFVVNYFWPLCKEEIQPFKLILI